MFYISRIYNARTKTGRSNKCSNKHNIYIVASDYLAGANARLYVPLDPNITESPDANGIHTAIGFSDDVHNAKK